MCDASLQVRKPKQDSAVTVLKFGGSSVKSIGRMQHVVGIIQEVCRTQKALVVVSAMGDTTDHLIDLAQQCTNSPDKRELDVLLSTGEQVSIALLCILLKAAGITAKSFTGAQIGVLTESEHTSARILSVDAIAVQKALAENDVVVVAGFQGVTVDGDITTLGRGGSDTTAVALAAAAGAQECQIYTDVDGIFTSDPNKNADAQWIPEISYDDCLQLVRAGAQVMHDRSVVLAQQYGIDVRVRNTFKPSHPGTVICNSPADAGTQRQVEYETRSFAPHANNCGQIRELEPRQLQYAV
jgi:aspartate kinase